MRSPGGNGTQSTPGKSPSGAGGTSSTPAGDSTKQLTPVSYTPNSQCGASPVSSPSTTDKSNFVLDGKSTASVICRLAIGAFISKGLGPHRFIRRIQTRKRESFSRSVINLCVSFFALTVEVYFFSSLLSILMFAPAQVTLAVLIQRCIMFKTVLFSRTRLVAGSVHLVPSFAACLSMGHVFKAGQLSVLVDFCVLTALKE